MSLFICFPIYSGLTKRRSAGNYYFWIPMVAPFFGCTFGGWLYDMFLFTGDSPINTPWMGLKRFIKPTANTWSNTRSETYV